MKKTIVQTIIFGFLFLVVGLGVIFLGFGMNKSYKEKEKSYVDIEATVIGHEQEDIGESSYFTIVEYQVDGLVYNAKTTYATSNPTKIGDVINIKYNPINPSDVIFENKNYLLIVVGSVFSFVGLFLTFRGICLKRSSQSIQYDSTNINQVDSPI